MLCFGHMTIILCIVIIIYFSLRRMSSTKFFLVVGIDIVSKGNNHEDEFKKVELSEQHAWYMMKHKIEIHQDHPLYSNLKIGDKLTIDMHITSMDDYTVVYDNILRTDFNECLNCLAFFEKDCEHMCPLPFNEIE